MDDTLSRNSITMYILLHSTGYSTSLESRARSATQKLVKQMKHFEVEQWLDFVRGLAGTIDRVAMEQHLSQGCKKCSATVERLRRFVAAAAADARYQIPDWAVRSACDIFGRQRPDKGLFLPVVRAKLVFDSFREPGLAGVRSQAEIMHQAMYEAGDYCVDLRAERERGADAVVLTGQIGNATQPEQRVSGVLVILMSGKEVVGRTVSNGSGEFQIECQAKKSLRLHVPLEQAGKRIEVPLKNLFDAGKRSASANPKVGISGHNLAK